MRGIEARFVDTRHRYLHIRNVHSFGGDVLVVQHRGIEARTKANQRKSLTDLHLGDPRDAAIVDESDRPLFGKVQTGQHLLVFRGLPYSVPVARLSDLWLLEDGGMIYREDYGDRRRPGETIVVGDGQYVQVETRGKYVAINWTSAVNPAEFFASTEKVLGSFGVSDEAAYVQLVQTGPYIEDATGSATDALTYLNGETPPLHYVRIDLRSGVRASWAAPAANVEGSERQFTELSVEFEGRESLTSVEDLIGITGSPALRENKDEALARVQQFAI